MEGTMDESLLWRYFDKAVSEEEKRSVEEWIHHSEENKELAHKIAGIYFASNLLRTSKEVDTRKGLDTFWNRLERKKKLRFWQRAGRIAAIFLLPVIAFSAYVWFGRGETVEQPEQWVEVCTQAGITNSIVLPDSSVVYLNSESQLKYPSHFARSRTVYLQGEAFFIVKKHQKSRFVVNTPAGAQVEVLGTEFNVNSRAQEVDATLVKGSVKFICRDKDNKEESIAIVPGQKVSYDVRSKSVELREVDVDSEIEWREGKTVFKNCPLMEALDILSKRYNAEFIIKNEALKENTFTGSFKNQSLEQILENFMLSTDMKYKYVNKRANGQTTSEREVIELY